MMPDVVGLQESRAFELLSEAQVEDIRVEEEPSLEPAGLVLDQLPSADTEVRGPVTLTVAVPLPVMPDYEGVRVGDARTELSGWGVAVVEEPVLSSDRPDGEVLTTTPVTGEVIGSEVVLRFAVSPVVGVPGVDIELIESGYEGLDHPESGPIEVNGTLYEDSLYSFRASDGVDPGDRAYWEYNLGRDWEAFQATIGLSDESEFEQAGRFRVSLDGAVIWEQDVQFGQALPVDLNVSGGLRLGLEVVSLGEGRIGLVWGSAKMLGIPGVAPAE